MEPARTQSKKQLIPKTIHYVWLGGSPKPRPIRRCMRTWRRLKGYKFKEWNETNIDVKAHPFLQRAIEHKQWAFASDYIRAWAIYNYGGIYFDTDIIVVRSLDHLLKDRAFVGYETPDYPFTAVFGAEKHHPFVKSMLDYYDNLKIGYRFEDNNTRSTTKILIEKYGCRLGNKEQNLRTNIHVYPDGILCNPSPDSLTIHAFTKTWRSGLGIKDYILGGFRTRLTNRFMIWLYWHYRQLKK